MFKNYVKIAIRSLLKHKIYSFINITGFSIGMAGAILILLWVQDELSFDRFHQNYSNIYRVISKVENPGNTIDEAGTPAPLGPVLKEEFPEITGFTRYFHVDKTLVNRGKISFSEDNFVYADPSIIL